MKKLTTWFSVLFSCILMMNIVSAQTPVRRVLLEEFTTASCGNCPMMSAYVTDWHLANAAGTVLLSIHEGSGVDAMSSATTAAIFNAMHPAAGWFAPAMMIDRGVYSSTGGEAYLSCYQSWGSVPSPGVDSIATRLMNEPAKVGVNISGTYNSITRTINATVNAKFVDTVPSGDWRINLFLVEDSVVGWPGLGPFVGWDQHCYDTPWANANYPGMFDGTSIIGYPHRHVMRNSFLGNWGIQGVIPAIPVVGTNYTTTSSLVVDTAYHDNHLSLVAFVSSYGGAVTQKYVLNANDVILAPTFSTGLNEITAQNKSHFSIENIYPNPALEEIIIKYTLEQESKSEILISNVIGQTIGSLHSALSEVGTHEISFTTSKLSKGIYYITLKTSTCIETRKFIVE